MLGHVLYGHGEGELAVPKIDLSVIFFIDGGPPQINQSKASLAQSDSSSMIVGFETQKYSSHRYVPLFSFFFLFFFPSRVMTPGNSLSVAHLFSLAQNFLFLL